MRFPMPWAANVNRSGGRWLRWLLLGAVAAMPLLGAPRAVLAIEISEGRLRGELQGVPARAAVEELAELLGARLRWLSPAADDVVEVHLTGLTVEQGLARILGKRSYLLRLGARPEIHVLGDSVREASDSSAADLPAEEEEIAQLRAAAAIDQIAHADAENEDVAAELDSVVRGEGDPTVRLAAAERLLDLDPEHAASALAWLTTDADPAVQQRAEALFAFVQPDRLAAR